MSVGYPPEAITAAALASDVASEMAARGHSVTVLAPFPNRPQGRVLGGYRRRLRSVDDTGPCRVVRVWHTLSRRPSVASRLAENISFGISSSLELLRLSRPDVVLLNTWPLGAQWITTLVLSQWRVPFVCAVKDLYPESAWQHVRLIRHRGVAALLQMVDRAVYRRSTVVAPINEVMRQAIVATRRIDPAKVRVMPDWTSTEGDSPGPGAALAVRRELGLPADCFVAMFAGSMSHTAGLDAYPDVAERLRARRDIRIVLVGDGNMRERLLEEAHRRSLTNLRIVHPLRPQDVPRVQSAADVLLLSLLPASALHTPPSKLLAYMRSERSLFISLCIL